MGGDPDLAENYSEITFSVNQLADGKIELTYVRLKIPTEMETQIFEAHVPAMLEEIKKLAEH